MKTTGLLQQFLGKSIITKLVMLLVMVLLFTNSSKAQTNTFRTYQPINPGQAGKLYFHVESTGFLKNNEYFSQFAYGYTGIGIYLKPTLDYYFSRKLGLTAGVYMLKYAGLDNLTQVIPTFSIRYKPTETIDVIMGNIYGTANHRLAEPLFRYDLFYQHHIEYGVQFLWNTKHFKTDLWLNWRHFIQLGDTLQEELTVGSSSSVILYDDKTIKVSIPVQFLINHQGGQFAPPPRPSTTTIVNGYLGADLSIQLNENWQLGFSENMALYNGLSFPTEGVGSLPAKKGWGNYLKMVIGWKNLHWMAGYWHGDNFIAPLGETQFQSVSEIDPLVYQRNRNLITGKLWYNKTIMKGAVIEARFETFYDTDHHQVDYSYGLWLKINSSFFLTKAKAE